MAQKFLDVDGAKAGLKLNFASPWFWALLSCFALMFFFAARLLGDADLGFHLRGGKWIWENLRFPSVDIYTTTRAGSEYLDLQWSYQLLLYFIYRVGDYFSLSLLNVFLIGAVFFITFKRLRLAGAPLFMCVPLLASVLLASEIRFQLRPEVLSWLLMSLMLLVLEMRMLRGVDLLFFLPLLQLVWTNVEALFPIGWAVMGFYAANSFLQETPTDRKLLRYSGLALAVSFLNPYGLKGVLHPFSFLAAIGSSNVFKQYVVEFQSPWRLLGLSPFGPRWAVFAYTLYALAVLFLLGVTYRRRKIHEFLLAGAFLYLSAAAMRNIPLFQLATLPLAATCWKDLKWSWVLKLHEIFLSKPSAAWLSILLALGLCARIATNSYYVSQGRTDRFGLGLDKEFQPVQAAEFLVKHSLDGRVLNHLNMGGWLEWAVPQKVFADGRTEIMGEEFFTEHMASLSPGGLARIAAKYEPDILFFRASTASNWVIDLGKTPDWRLVYLDEAAVVFLKKGYAPQVPVLDGEKLLAERGLGKPSPTETLTVLRAPEAGILSWWLKEFYESENYPRGLNHMALLYFYLSDYGMAESFSLECLRRGKGKYFDLYYNPGLMFYYQKRHEEARLCFERVLKDVPDDSSAKTILGNIRTH